MFIIANQAELQELLVKIGEGYAPCQLCGQMRPRLFKIPERYKRVPSWRAREMFVGTQGELDKVGYTPINKAETEKLKDAFGFYGTSVLSTEMACEYCISRIARAIRVDNTDECDSCHKMYKYHMLKGYAYRLGVKHLIATFCPICHDEAVAKIEGMISDYKWRKDETQRVKAHNSRASMRGAEGSLTLDQWAQILVRYDWKCAYCGGPYECLEHVIPVSAGGGTTAGNCVPSCNKCNAAKGRKDPRAMLIVPQSWAPVFDAAGVGMARV